MENPLLRALMLEHLVLQWENGIMSSEGLDRCLRMIPAPESKGC